MSKYGAEIQEKAYDLFMIQQLSFMDVIRKMHISKGTLTKWKNDPKLDWEGRYSKHCEAIAEKNDAERIKKIKPILYTIQDIREKVYNELITFLEKGDTITDKNLGLVLSSFVKMGDLEYRISGGNRAMTPVRQVINVLIMVLEKNPNVGPVIAAHKSEIEEAIFEEIKSGT